MNKEKLIGKIDFEIKDLLNAIPYHPTNKEYINGGLAELLKMKAFIQSEQEETCDYMKWLENMVKLLAGCYQETHDMLLEKAKSKESNLYFEMPTVQGTTLVFAVNDISKLKAIGTVPSSEKLNEYIKRLEKAGE